MNKQLTRKERRVLKRQRRKEREKRRRHPNRFTRNWKLATMLALAGGVAVTAGHFYRKHLRSPPPIEQKEYSASRLKREVDVIFSVPYNYSDNREEFKRCYRETKNKAERAFGITIPVQSLGVPIINEVWYHPPFVFEIHSDPRLFVLSRMHGKQMNEFMKFLLDNFKQEPVSDNIYTHKKILKKQQGVCLELSVVLCNLLASIGIQSDIITIDPWGCKSPSLIPTYTPQGHAVVRIKSGKLKNCVMDPGQGGYHQSLFRYINSERFREVVHSMSGYSREKTTTEGVVILIARSFRADEVPDGIKEVLRYGSKNERFEVGTKFLLEIEKKSHERHVGCNEEKFYEDLDRGGVIAIEYTK